MDRLVSRIASKDATIGVIGLGCVGLTVATAFAGAGFRVVGVDVKADHVARVQAGQCPIEGIEPELPELLKRVTAERRLVAVTSYKPLAECEIVLIAVDTPVAQDRRARFTALRAACRDLARVLRPGTLVIVESTVAPGTCQNVVAPLLEEGRGWKAGKDFFLGHCPERVMPGRLLANLRELARVCGGSTPETTAAMVALYGTVVRGPLHETDLVTAELVKTAENAYRDVNIAFANELGLICEAVGADFGRVRTLVNDAPGRNVLVAGAGVGGHCIPKDPWLLANGVPGFEPRLIAAARAVNDGMPAHVARLVAGALGQVGKSVRGARVAVLGYAYLENTDDARNSPSKVLVDELGDAGADVAIHDPYMPEHARDLWETVTGAHAAVIMVAHDAYRELDLGRLRAMLAAPVLVDGRHVVDAARARAAGLVFRGVGRGVL